MRRAMPCRTGWTTLLTTLLFAGAAGAQSLTWSQLFKHTDPVSVEPAAIISLGDIDNDGHDDYAIGGRRNDSYVDIISGCKGVSLRRTKGFKRGDGFGSSLALIHDVNNDKVPDILVGAPSWDRSSTDQNVGRVAIISTKDGTIFRTFNGANAKDEYGKCTANVGDVDKDGTPDYAIAATGYKTWGRVYVMSGKTHLQLKIFDGAKTKDRFGHSVIGVGDLDKDGHADLAICASGLGVGTDPGYIKVFSGKFKILLHTFTGPWGPIKLVGDLDGDKQPDLLLGAKNETWAYGVIPGSPVPKFKQLFSIKQSFNDHLNTKYADLGDLNGDNVSEIAIAQTNTKTPDYGSGSVRVFSGKTQSQLVEIRGHGQNVSFGMGLDSADVNADGRLDLLVAEPGRQVFGLPVDQAAWIYSLGTKKLPLTTNTHTISLTAGGTVNYNVNVGAKHAGQVYYFAGSASGYRPGFNLWGHHFPLNIDTYFDIIVSNPNGPILSSSFGFLNANGKATSTLKIPAGLPPSYIGITVHHAAAILGKPTDPFRLDMVTNARPVTMVK